MTDKLPKAVQEQIERAERLAAQLRQDQQPEPAPTENAAAEQPSTEGTDEPELPEIVDDNPPPVLKAEDLPQQLIETENLTRELELWQQRYRTLQGKYNAEMRQLRERITELEAKLAALTKAEDKPNTTAAQPQTTVADDVAQAVDAVLAKYANDFDTDTLNLVREAVTAATQKLKRDLQPVVERIQSVQVSTLHSILDRRLPGWREQNHDPEFLAWLAEPEPALGWAGTTRQEVLWQAYTLATSGDPAAQERGIEGIVQMFNGWPGAAKYRPVGTRQQTDERRPEQPQVRQTALTRPAAPEPVTLNPEPPKRVQLTRAQVSAISRRLVELMPRVEYDAQARREYERLNRMLNEALASGSIQ